MAKFKFSQYKIFLLLLICLFAFNKITFSQVSETDKKIKHKQSQPIVDKNAIPKLNKLPPAFTFQWQFATRSATKLPALAEDQSVYLPLSDGRVVALDASNGQLRWETQPGGKIISPLVANSEQIYISSRLEKDALSSEGVLRVINKQSGLTAWTKNFPQAFSTPLTLIEQTIYVANEDTNFYSLNSQSGNVNWSAPLGALSKSKALITDKEVFIGTEANVMHCLSISDGKEIWQFKSKGPLRAAPTANEEHVFFGDSFGYLYCLDRKSGKLVWQVRTSAAIESTPQLAGKFLVTNSFDNFVYGFSAKSGDTAWKVRLTGRLSFDPIAINDQILITPLSSDKLFLLSKEGKLLGQFHIENSSGIIATPTLQSSSLFLVTDEGLIAARSKN